MEGEQGVLRLVGVHKTFLTGEVETLVLRGIDLTIGKGEITVILGPSGSGKSTLLNLIGGLDRPTAGNVYFQGEDLSRLGSEALTLYRRENVGFVFQFYNLVPTLTALENVAVAAEIAKTPMDAMAALELVAMRDRANFFPAQLSGGQQQRVSIARALVKNPAVLLCDEPTGALDIETGCHVLKTLVDVNRELGATILIITHAEPIARLANRVVRVMDGTIHSDERVEAPESVEAIFR